MDLQGLKPLSSTEVRAIQDATAETLERVGVVFRSQAALDALGGAGARVDRESGRVRIPRALLQQALETVPKEFTLHDRAGAPALPLQGRASYAVAGNLANFVLDAATGERRLGTRQDVAEFARLADALPHVHAVANQVVPQDVPGRSAMVHACHALLSNTSKPLVLWAPDGATARAVLAMTETVGGQAVAERPFLLLCNTVTSPLLWDEKSCEVLMEAARRGVPQGPTTCPIAGMTAPMNLAGYLAQANAEVLSGVVLAQVIRPGTPMVVTYAVMTADMREGTPILCTPEAVLLRSAVGQLLAAYDLPGLMAACDSDAHVMDEQNGWERLLAMVSTLDTRLHLLVNAGMFATGFTVSPAQLVIDDELMGYCLRLRRGIEVPSLESSVDLIERVGPGGNFLEYKETLHSLRREHWLTKVSSHRTFQKWQEMGARDIVQAASERARSLLATHRPMPLTEEVEEQLAAVVRRFEGESA